MKEDNYSNLIKIIPTYNEKENVAKLAGFIFEKMPQASILVVDDNSPDGTADLVDSLKQKFPTLYLHRRTGQKGFGRSYVDGFKKVLCDDRFKYIVMMDADFSHDPTAVPAMLAKLQDNDVVIGSRYINGGGISNWNFKRRMLSRFANLYARSILRVPIHDLTTGFMCFKKDVLNRLDPDSLKSDGYGFLIELKYKMHKVGAKMIEHPIIFSERREGQSKMSTKIIWESVKLPWKLLKS